MAARFPGWMLVAILLQLGLSGLFFLYGYSATASYSQGRSPTAADIAAIALPLALTALFGLAAWALWRAERRGLAAVLVLAPLPASIVAYGSMGIFY